MQDVSHVAKGQGVSRAGNHATSAARALLNAGHFSGGLSLPVDRNPHVADLFASPAINTAGSVHFHLEETDAVEQAERRSIRAQETAIRTVADPGGKKQRSEVRQRHHAQEESIGCGYARHARNQNHRGDARVQGEVYPFQMPPTPRLTGTGSPVPEGEPHTFPNPDTRAIPPADHAAAEQQRQQQHREEGQRSRCVELGQHRSARQRPDVGFRQSQIRGEEPPEPNHGCDQEGKSFAGVRVAFGNDPPDAEHGDDHVFAPLAEPHRRLSAGVHQEAEHSGVEIGRHHIKECGHGQNAHPQSIAARHGVLTAGRLLAKLLSRIPLGQRGGGSGHGVTPEG